MMMKLTRKRSFLRTALSLATTLLAGMLPLASLSAQGVGPSIGVDRLPGDAEPVCTIPMADDHNQDFSDVGLMAGEIAPDFTLYDLDGMPFNLKERLASGKGVLLVNGSYTCPVFRGKIRTINRVAEEYGDRLDVVVIYTVEAHPEIDTSVYFANVNTGSSNINNGILYRQPTTYGERKEIVADMLDATTLEVPVYIDGPCNNWWEVYGFAPNNAYLIDTTGEIVTKHGWFDRAPNDIDRDVLEFLGEETGGEDTTKGDLFTLELTTDNIVTGPVDDVIYAHADITNPGTSPVVIDILRREQQMPEGWETSLCVDVCYASTVDSAQIVVEPGETQIFTLYFYTGPTPDTARVSVFFRNAANPENRFRLNLGGVTSGISAVEEEWWSWPKELGLE